MYLILVNLLNRLNIKILRNDVKAKTGNKYFVFLIIMQLPKKIIIIEITIILKLKIRKNNERLLPIAAID